MNNTYNLIVSENDIDLRVDKFIADQISELSRSRIQSIMKEGAITDKTGATLTQLSYRVKLHEEFFVTIPQIKEPEMLASDIPLNIVYEDSDLLVINKQAGLIVHPGAGNYNDTMANALLSHCGDSLSGIGGVQRPGIVHRLDKDTSGLIVVAKNDAAHASLAQQIQTRELKRIYNAVIWGVITPPAGKINVNIARNNKDRTKMIAVASGGRTAITHYKTKKIFHNKIASLVECRLETGRTHQIRVHFQHKGFSLIGDQTYGKSRGRNSLKDVPADIKQFLRNFPRQALHSVEMAFTHPSSGEEMHFSCPLPDDFEELLTHLAHFVS